MLESPYLMHIKCIFWPWPKQETQSNCLTPSPQQSCHMWMLTSDALYAEMGYCLAASCLGVRGLRIQVGETKITKLLGRISAMHVCGNRGLYDSAPGLRICCWAGRPSITSISMCRKTSPFPGVIIFRMTYSKTFLLDASVYLRLLIEHMKSTYR